MSLGHPVLGLRMVIQVIHRHFHVVLGALYPLADLLPVGVSLPRRPYSVGLHIVPPKRAARLLSHAHHLGHIFVEAHVVK